MNQYSSSTTLTRRACGLRAFAFAFCGQLRDERHHCLPGVECGDVGTKMGDNAIDTGYMRLRGVRIPRTHMLAKRQHVEPDGTYVKHKPTSAKTAARKVKFARVRSRLFAFVHIVCSSPPTHTHFLKSPRPAV